MDGIYIYYIKMPTKTNSVVTENADGSFSIFINDSLSYEKQMEACRHELFHIMNNDFGKDNVEEIEIKAHSVV